MENEWSILQTVHPVGFCKLQSGLGVHGLSVTIQASNSGSSTVSRGKVVPLNPKPLYILSTRPKEP